MAEPFIKLGLTAADPLIRNYDTIYAKTKQRVLKRSDTNKQGSRNEPYYEEAYQTYNVPRRSATEGAGAGGRMGGKPYVEQGRAKAYRDGDDYRVDREYSRSHSRDHLKDVAGGAAIGGAGAAAYAANQNQNRGRARSVGGNDRYYTEDGRGYNKDRYRPKSEFTFSVNEVHDDPPANDHSDYRRDSSTASDSESDSSSSGSSSSGQKSRGGARSVRSGKSGKSGRNTNAVAKYTPRDGPATNGTSTKKSSSKSSSDSDSGSSIVSSSEDERMQKKVRGKAMLTAGLAAVATIQAASSVYASMEARDKRHEAVLNKELSVEEARKERNKARLQDVAAIGIAALGIKGAYAKWQGATTQANGYREHRKLRKERHQKRVEKGKDRKSRTNGGGGDNGNGNGNSGQKRLTNGESGGGGGGGGGGGQGGGQGRSRPGYDRGISYNNSEPDLNRAYRNGERRGGGGGGGGNGQYQDGNPYGAYGNGRGR
ncbi:hypothetical protein MMC25_000746 [Agyrium rufum]|nr:hypothetical protein [Agyrium rufum]